MKGRLTLQVLDNQQRVIATRRADNAVMRGGGELVARLFAGLGGGAITHVAVGVSDAPESDQFSTSGLSNAASDGIVPLTGATEVAIPQTAFTVDVDSVKRVVWVRARTTLPASAAVGTIREAGLLARKNDTATLYNRVVFAPVEKRDSDELTLFWEVSFPYGDLQWTL
jgi:hypothetical protein